MATVRSATAASAAFALAGCGDAKKSDDSAAGVTTAAAPVPTLAGGSHGADWAREPCKSFPVAAAAKASGMPVTTAEVGNIVEQDSITNGSCGYTDGGMGHFRVALHIDTGGKQTVASQIAQMTERADTVGPMEPIRVAVGKAFWVPNLQEVVYYPDDRRSVTVIPPGANLFDPSKAPAGLQAKALAIALAAAG